LAGNSLLSLQPVHDEEADQDQGESEAEQQVQPSDIGICGHRSTLRFLEAGIAFLESFPAYALMRPWDKKVLRYQFIGPLLWSIALINRFRARGKTMRSLRRCEDWRAGGQINSEQVEKVDLDDAD